MDRDISYDMIEIMNGLDNDLGTLFIFPNKDYCFNEIKNAIKTYLNSDAEQIDNNNNKLIGFMYYNKYYTIKIQAYYLTIQWLVEPYYDHPCWNSKKRIREYDDVY